MTGRAWAWGIAAAGAILLGAPRCAPRGVPDCAHPPCPEPTAIIISVTSSSGEPITTASANVTGTSTTAIPCHSGSLSNMCMVLGTAGTYDVRVTAPGFQSVTQSVVVTGSTPTCGCGTVNTRLVTIVLPAV